MLRRNSNEYSLISAPRLRTRHRSFRLEIEPLETRNLLTASPISVSADAPADDDSAQESLVRDYLAQDAGTAYLLAGSSDLRLVGIDRDLLGTTTRFQQTYDGLPIYNAIQVIRESEPQRLGTVTSG